MKGKNLKINPDSLAIRHNTILYQHIESSIQWVREYGTHFVRGITENSLSQINTIFFKKMSKLSMEESYFRKVTGEIRTSPYFT